MGWDPTWKTLGTESLGWGGGRAAEVGWLLTPWPWGWSRVRSGSKSAGGDVKRPSLDRIPFKDKTLWGSAGRRATKPHLPETGLQMPHPDLPLGFQANNISPLQR